MKKITAVLLAICFILSMSVFSVSAASADVLKGTPTVDGLKDEIYNQSWSTKVGATFYNTGDVDGNADATLYILYDDANIYLCCEVLDDDVMAADPAYVKDDANPWMSEAVEVWVAPTGDETVFGKFSVEQSLGRLFYEVRETGVDEAKLVGKTQAIAGGYCVEIVVPFPAGGKEGNSIGISLQINDFHGDSTSAMGSQNPADNIIKLGAAVVPPATEAPATEAEVVVAPEAEAAEAAPEAAPAKSNPITADGFEYIAILALVAVISFAALKKAKVK